MQKIKTHFEQISVTAVKQLMKDLPPAHDKDNHAADDWRVLAQRAQQEPDTDKMIELIQQLIQKFDEEKLAKSRAWYRAKDREASQL